MTLLPDHIALVTTNAQALPVFFHSAILFMHQGKPMVVHNTMSGLEVLPYDTFNRQRTVYRIRQFPLRRPFNIYEVVQHYAPVPFSWFSNNCEDFTRSVLNRYTTEHYYISSPQRCAVILLALAIILWIIRYERLDRQ